jgi:hypothetical protein
VNAPGEVPENALHSEGEVDINTTMALNPSYIPYQQETPGRGHDPVVACQMEEHWVRGVSSGEERQRLDLKGAEWRCFWRRA